MKDAVVIQLLFPFILDSQGRCYGGYEKIMGSINLPIQDNRLYWQDEFRSVGGNYQITINALFQGNTLIGNYKIEPLPGSKCNESKIFDLSAVKFRD